MFAQDRTWQRSLFATAEPSVDDTFASRRRQALDRESWIDVVPRWLGGADAVLEQLCATLCWRQRIVTMYDRRLPEPRLTWWWKAASASGANEPGADAPGHHEPLAVLADARRALSEQYGITFDSIGCNWYRDGQDSVAWHSDRFARSVVNPTVAIITVGAARPFRVRPKSGGPSMLFEPGDGDLLVMGGACQHRWQHCVPKIRAAGPRVSITFRHDADYRPRNAAVRTPA